MSRQSFSLHVGAIIVWLAAFNTALETIQALADASWLLASVKAVAAVGAVLIGRDIWRAA
jgi:hypothetical protein